MTYPYLTVEQNQHLAVLKARAVARAEYKEQGICTDLFYDDFVADCSHLWGDDQGHKSK
jgi:hypothetical protein